MGDLERTLLVQSVLYPFSYDLLYNRFFLDSDIAHYHLIHNHFFSVTALPLLSRLKPTVWTLHDPWAMTGHCVQPLGCDRWKTGCGFCPHLNSEFVMSQDATALNWEIKNLCYHNSDIDIIVASKTMLDMAKQSPLLSEFRVHQIPFGINLDVFRPVDVQEVRKQFGIAPDAIVLAFRSTTWQLKGLDYVKNVLNKLKPARPICLLTFNDTGLLDEYKGRFQIVELGWIYDTDQLVAAYNAADIVLMPSEAESFGMMAIEAMACAKPVIVFRGTALEDTVSAPLGGSAVPKNTDALLAETRRLVNDSDARAKLGEAALKIARTHYDASVYVERTVELYEEVVKRKQTDNRTKFIVSQLQAVSVGREETPDVAGREDLAEATQNQPIMDILVKLNQIRVIRFVAYRLLLPIVKIGCRVWANHKSLCL
jgi:glycosyltransferase involved in cell wall biosynthesis